MTTTKRIAPVAHDNRKKDLIEWVEWNWELLASHELICTGTTGRLVEESLKKRVPENTSSLLSLRMPKSAPRRTF